MKKEAMGLLFKQGSARHQNLARDFRPTRLLPRIQL